MAHPLRDFAERLERKRTERRTIIAFEKARHDPHLARDIGVNPRNPAMPKVILW